MKSSASESRLFQSQSMIEIPGWARQEEWLSGSKLKQVFQIDSDTDWVQLMKSLASEPRLRRPLLK